MKSPLASISSWVGSRSVYFLSSEHQCRPISFNYLCSSSLQPCFWHNLTARASVVVHYCVHDDCALIAWFKLIIMIEMIVAPSKEIGLLHWNKLTSTSDHDCFMAVKMLRSQVADDCDHFWHSWWCLLWWHWCWHWCWWPANHLKLRPAWPFEHSWDEKSSNELMASLAPNL